jgi:hypothetical protein
MGDNGSMDSTSMDNYGKNNGAREAKGPKLSSETVRRAYLRKTLPTINEPASTKIWRKFQVNAPDALRIFEHFEALTPFIQVAEDIGVNMDTLSRMFISRWREDLAQLRQEMRGWNGSTPIEEVVSDVQTANNRPMRLVSAKTISDVRALLHLRIAPDDVQAYLQLDRDAFISALNHIHKVRSSG